MPEVVEDGVTGFIVDDVDGAVGRRCAGWTRSTAAPSRQRFETRWTAWRMAEDYVALYQRLARPARPKLRRGT